MAAATAKEGSARRIETETAFKSELSLYLQERVRARKALLATQNKQLLQTWAKMSGLRHWHTSSGIVVGQRSQGCPLCQ